MNAEISPEKALSRAMALCSRSEQAAADIRKKMSAWGASPVVAEKVIARLTADGFIDEYRYAHAFVHDKFKFNGWGRRKIENALRMKHISANAIDEAFLEIDAGEYSSSAESVIRAKYKSLCGKGKDTWTLRASLLRFAASRGFELDMASRIISEILKSDYTNNGDEFPDNEWTETSDF